ncbi:hypothetical protein [Streptomyces sp. NPDC059452]|uniref:hypothetical protein n=1 Tax=Streptomyces sp. NPDC059452 TaxID=3346835 RepID=UPI0036B3122F
MPMEVTAAAVDLGFAAFVERNTPRYLRYARAHLPAEDASAAAVTATLASARNSWGLILSRPCPAAEVWQELRLRVGRQAGGNGPRDPALAVLYGQLPDGSADSVVLCCRLGFDVSEAAELMGVETPAVEAALAIARRALPEFVEGGHP